MKRLPLLVAFTFVFFTDRTLGQPSLAAESSGPSGRVEFKGCCVTWSEKELVISNRHIERKWQLRNGRLIAKSFRNLHTGTEWIREPAKQPAPVSTAWGAHLRSVSISAACGRLDVPGEESLQVFVKDPARDLILCRFRVFPEASGVEILSDSEPESPVAEPTAKMANSSGPIGLETETTAAVRDTEASLENLLLSPRHLRLTQAQLLDQSDMRNELVQESEWLLLNERGLELAGNVFAVENHLTGEGLVFVKFAPLPHARPVKTAWDCQVNASQRRVRFAASSYPAVLLAYSGGRAGRTMVLQDFQRQLRRYVPERDGMFQSNTWGDRSADGRVSEAFLLQEIAAGARLGVDVVQIDDGWQKGMSGNSAFGKGAWGKFYAADPGFWTPHPTRFPNGLQPVVAAARAQQMKLGLWFAPDSTDDNVHWERDAELVLGNYRKLGIQYVKIDAVQITSPAGEANLHKFYDRVIRETDGRVAFDSDITAGLRPGYFGLPATGPIYVENRYTDWQNYWPHHTLRNLWKLAHYVDPLRLRMEFLNNTRNVKKYGDDPLAPGRYPPDYLFASVMAANPLGFFEVSNLPEDYIASVSKLVAVWKRERREWFSGKLIPIGSVPDGRSWTGFASVGPDQRSGYVLVFRELNAQAEWSVALPLFGRGPYRLDKLAGTGTATLVDGKLTVTIPESQRYLWLKITSDQ